MSLFSPIVDVSTSPSLIVPSSPVPTPEAGPLPRFAGEPVRWVACGNSANVCAFARGAARVFSGASGGIPGSPGLPWTLVEISPLPAYGATVLLALPGGLPVQYVLMTAQATAVATDNMAVSAGEAIAKAGSGTGFSVWFGLCAQDRIVRDPALWSAQIEVALSAAGVDSGNWPAFAAALAGLGAPARPIYILDHVGRPFAPYPPHTAETFTIATNAGTASITLTAASDGNTGIPLPASDQAHVAFASATHPLVAGAEVEGGNLDGSFQLAQGERHAQVADVESWFAERDAGASQLARWNPDSFVEPIVDGNPYFARLVADLRSTKGGGGAGLAGWAFVKESLLDKTLPWPLIPGQDDTQLVPLIKELVAGNAQIRLLVNQFLQFEGGTFDDSEAALAILWALFAATFPLAAFGLLTTDPAGFGVLFGAMAIADFLLSSPFTLDVLRAIGEPSKGTVDDLTPVSQDLIRWSPYPATTADNPLFSPPLSLVGVTIDDIIHFGVYHQKFVVGKSAAGDFFGYLGGIDINSDRPDSPLHRALFPYHDVQTRVTGPALKDLIQSYAERITFDHGTPPFDVPATPPALPPGEGRHLVQIGRTYFRPKTTGTGLPFASSGETLIHRTNLRAIKAARDFIYIEDQYFTPDDEYAGALIEAAGHARALIITLCMQNGQAFGPIRRTDVLAALKAAWGTRVKVGALVRRFLNPTPAKTVNLGRCVLASDITASSPTITIGPKSHVPDAPFWAFVENELLQVMAPQGPPDANGNQAFYVTRGPIGSVSTWGAKVDKHGKGSPVMCVRVPDIYVHAKLMIVDDVFLSVGSANMNRRGHFHDGEINALTMPQHLKRDPSNPAHVLRCRLWAEHLGLTPEMGLSLLSDPLSALPYFDRSWFAGNRWQPLAWSGSETDTLQGFGSSDTIGAELLQLAVGTAIDLYKEPFWPVLVDPTSSADPSSKPGPEYP
jgi:phosphatidylserine/phosphatidylglycerophosphate/cardiolipin synthase-like enzyme